MEESASRRGLSDAGKREGQREADRELAVAASLDFVHWSLCLYHAAYPRHLGQVGWSPGTLFCSVCLFAPTTMAPREADRIAAAQQTLDSTLLCLFNTYDECKHFLVLYDISQLLGTQLDKETLATCIGMIESGVNPEALAVSV